MPILPHPPGIGRKTSGSSLTKSACCSGVSFQVAAALTLGGKGGRDFAADAKVRRGHVRAFFGSVKAQGDSSEILRIHARSILVSGPNSDRPGAADSFSLRID